MLDRFKERSRETERLDRGEFTPSEYKHWEKEMWFLHRFFGEIRALKKSVLQEIDSFEKKEVSILDVAAGSGGLLNFIRKQANGRDIFTVGAESSPDAVHSIDSNGIPAVQCDALELPFAANSFDIVFCTLFLHHLDEEHAARLIAEMASVAKHKFFVIDLDRRPFPYFVYKAFGSLLLQKFTRDDGALSILRAYSSSELKRIADAAGAKDIKIERSAINRLVLSASG